MKMGFSFFILLLPAAVCLFWLLLDFVVGRRTSSYYILQVITLDLMLFFYADAFYCMPGVPPETQIYTHLITLFTGPSVIPLIWLYFSHLKKEKAYNLAQFLWVMIPFGLLLSGISLTETLGTERLARFISDFYTKGETTLQNYRGMPEVHYYRWTHVTFRIAVAAEMVYAAYLMLRFVHRENVRFANLWAFLRKGAPIRVTELQIYTLNIPALFVVTKVLFTKKYLETHLWISMTQALLIAFGFFLFRLCAWFGERKTLTRNMARHIMMENYSPENKSQTVEEMIQELIEDADEETINRLKVQLGPVQTSHDAHREDKLMKELILNSLETPLENNLLIRFQSLMAKEQLYLHHSLSVQDVAQRLRTNKTYISKIVNKAYDMGFPELINKLRIDYAKKYIKRHPEAKQDEIARACGFPNASAFNNIFKKITGHTPKTWMLQS